VILWVAAALAIGLFLLGLLADVLAIVFDEERRDARKRNRP